MAQRGRSAATGARPGARSGTPQAASPQAASHPAASPSLRPQELAALRDRLRRVVEPIIEAEELDLDDLSVTRAGRRYVVRITVDGDGGVGHNELTDVSRAISAGLDEAEQTGGPLTPDAYTLEVSSPGVDRPLTLPRHWRRSVGRLVKVTIREPHVRDKARDKQITGRVVAATDDTVSLEVDGQRRDVALADLGPGRVQVEFTRLAELTDDEIGALTEGDEELEDEA
jgi:ribosome maturation factor RimP